MPDKATTIELSVFEGKNGLANAALHFAEERIQSARKFTRPSHRTPTQHAIARKVAARALRDARAQLKAAIAILECDS